MLLLLLLPHPQDCERHLQEEERVLLPGLQEELSPQQLMQLGRLFEWAKLIAPSRWGQLRNRVRQLGRYCHWAHCG
jgi:hypothetical protein